MHPVFEHSFFDLVRADAARYLKGSNGFMRARKWATLILFVPGFQLCLSIRLQNLVVKTPMVGKLLRRVIWYVACVISSAEIDMSAQIGGGLYIPHSTGIVIRGDCKIGRNATILQCVTVGRRDQEEISQAYIGDNCKIFAGAKIIGNLRIGNNVTIGANAVVLKDIPDGATAVGVPARILQAQAVAPEPGRPI